MTKEQQLEQTPYLVVQAEARYWEDSRFNGVEDAHKRMPFIVGDTWNPVIDLREGKVHRWPEGAIADIHYKVCDAGQYYLADKDLNLTHKWTGDYVPDEFLCHGDDGYGDYIIMRIGIDGKIENWRCPEIDIPGSWEPIEV